MIGRGLQTATAKIAQVRADSVFVATVDKLTASITSIVADSYCYHWLTAAPDPAIIVIDLRTTHTVGPVTTLLQKSSDPIERAWIGSQSAAATTAIIDSVTSSRAGRVLAALLEPPANDTNDQTE